MAAPAKPWKAEYAKSARASCRTCKNNIGKEILRFGKMVQSPHFDGFMPMWHHSTCIMKKANQIKSIDDIEGIESLRWEDQQKIRKYIDGNGLASNTVATPPAPAAPSAYGIEISQTSRATCKHCRKKIIKEEVRISAKIAGQAAKSLTWYHAICFLELSPSTSLDSLSGWQSLPSAEQVSLQTVAKGKAPSADNGVKCSGEFLKDSKSRNGAKRKNVGDSDQLGKVVKTDTDMMMRKCATNALDSAESALESKLEAQTKELWELKDDLKKCVSTVELRQMLAANGQSTSGSELDLRDRCADEMMFGVLKCCPMCSGHLSYSGGTYKCHGYISEWSKCSYSTTQPERIKGKWKVPEETGNEYLNKWFKSQKAAKPVRMLPPSTPSKSSGNQTAKGQIKPYKDEKLEDLRVAIAGLPKETGRVQRKNRRGRRQGPCQDQ